MSDMCRRPEGGTLTPTYPNPMKGLYPVYFGQLYYFLIPTNTYWMIFGRAVISGGAEDNSRQKKSQQKNQQPEGKLPLDHMISI